MKTFKATVQRFFNGPTPVIEVLKKLTPTPEPLLREAIEKGAVWLQEKGRGKILRTRTPEKLLHPTDIITLFLDLKVLRFPEAQGVKLIFENKHYSVWFKPAGVVPQGTQAGDHASLLRFVEKHRGKEVFLIHRLDRETAGLMVVGHTSEAAAKLSRLFQDNHVTKIYEAVVLGDMEPGHKQTIDQSLDDKRAITHIEVMASKDNKSLIKVVLETGRLHQIRRHLDGIGYPLMGDPKYGKNNKNKEGLQLLAQSLSFKDPWSQELSTWSLDQHLAV